MASNGYPDDPNNYSESEPTQYANFGGTGGEAYSEYEPPSGGYQSGGYQSGGYPDPTGYPPYTGPAPQAPTTGGYPAPVIPTAAPWHQRPAVLVGLGVLTAALLALLVYAVVRFTTSGTAPSPAVTSNSATPTTSSAAATSSTAEPAPTTQTAAPVPTNTEAPAPPPPPPPPTTVTTTVTPTTTVAPTTTQAPSPSTTTSVTTSVTTVTETTTKPGGLFPNWPRPTKPTLMEPAPAG